MMQCPSCRNTDFPLEYKFCPQCGSALPRAQSSPRKIEHGEQGVETTQLQQSTASTSEDGELGLNKSSTQGNFYVNLLGLYYSWLLRIRYFIKAKIMKVPNGVPFDFSDFA